MARCRGSLVAHYFRGILVLVRVRKAAAHSYVLGPDPREGSFFLPSGEIFGRDEPMGRRFFRRVRAFDGGEVVHRQIIKPIVPLALPRRSNADRAWGEGGLYVLDSGGVAQVECVIELRKVPK